MSSIDGFNGSISWTSLQVTMNSRSVTAGQGSYTDTDAASHTGDSAGGGHAGFQAFMQSVTQSLSQLGINTDQIGRPNHGAGETPATYNNGRRAGSMSSIDEISAGISWTSLQVTMNSQSVAASRGSDTDVRAASRTRGSADGRYAGFQAFTQSVTQSRTQIRINSYQTSRPNHGVGMNSGARQALHSFAHSLLQALGRSNSSGTAADNTSASAQSGYGGNPTAKIMNLLQGISSSGTDSTQNGDLRDLNSSFQNLLQALGGNNASGVTDNASSSSPTLQAFLQTLSQNLSDRQTVQVDLSKPAGAIVSTSA